MTFGSEHCLRHVIREFFPVSLISESEKVRCQGVRVKRSYAMACYARISIFI